MTYLFFDYIYKTGFIFYPLFLMGLIGWYLLLIETVHLLSKKSIHDNSFINSTSYNHLKTIKMITATAPILGILGTVNGMIDAFKVISIYGNQNPNLMAEGISKALLTTQLGLTIAIPLMIGMVLLKRQIDKK